MRFKYVACTSGGEVLTGVLEAESEAQAEELLWQRDLTIISLKRTVSLPSLDEAFPSLFGVKRGDLITFSRELSNLLSSGIPLLHALNILAEQVRKPAFKRILRGIMAELQTGNSFSYALSQHPQVFPHFYVRLVQIGEGIGNLGLVLKQITAYLEREAELKARLSKSLVYPVFVLALSIVSVFILFNIVLPAMTGLMREFGGELPVTTRVLLTGSELIRAHISQILLGLLVGGLALAWYLRTPQGAAFRDRLLLHLPVIRGVVLASNLAAIARTLNLLTGAGVNITETLDMAIRTTGNRTFKHILSELKNDILEGKLLSQALARHSVIPPLFYQMIRVGEETGELQGNLQSLVNIYEEVLNRSLGQLVSLIEPALIIFVGGIVGFIAISIISPLYSLIGQVQ